MVIDYVKQEISTEICEDGGATARIVNNRVLPLGTAVEEAIRGNYAIGDKSLITGEIVGLVRSMVENCAKDGNARQVDGLFTVTPHYYGLIDPEKGHDPAVNGVELKIRLLKELKLDTKEWTYNDVTPGREPIKAQTVSTGDKSGEVVPGATSVIKITGYGCENVTGVDWEVPGTGLSGTFDASKITKSATVVTIADGLASLCAQVYDGMQIVFNVRGAKNASKVKGKLKYVKPTVRKTMTVGNDGGLVPRKADTLLFGSGVTDSGQVTGEMIKVTTYDKASGQTKTVKLTETAYEYAGLDGNSIRIAVPGGYEGEDPWGDWVDYTKPIKVELDYETEAAYNKCAVTASFAAEA